MMTPSTIIRNHPKLASILGLFYVGTLGLVVQDLYWFYFFRFRSEPSDTVGPSLWAALISGTILIALTAPFLALSYLNARFLRPTKCPSCGYTGRPKVKHGDNRLRLIDVLPLDFGDIECAYCHAEFRNGGGFNT